MTSLKTTSITIRNIPQGAKRHFKFLAAQKGKTMSQILLAYIQTYLTKKKI